ncbi:hypothetical protein ACKA06_11620 [Rossellomorea oryzaecorticis]|uniref:DNA helicase n=1 Tax=Rossellomorea oryzaecorticis TaxID=1396505 RepID=A0ABW8VQ19_9BACI
MTNRFGNEIANHLNVLMPNANIQAYPEKKSFKPIILLYKDEEEIYLEYQKIIEEYESLDKSFKKSTKEDKVLVWARNWSSLVKKGAVYKNKKQKKIKSVNVDLKSFIIDFIIKRICNESGNLSELKSWINNHPSILRLNTILVKILKNGFTSTTKNDLNKFMNELLEEKGSEKINGRNKIYKQIEMLITNLQQSDVNTEIKKDDIYTIHSVKGETLRSVLVVDFKDKPLTKILLHRYGITNDDEYLYTDHNLLYVSMSRVTHLFVFAMHEDDWTDKVQEELNKSWEVKRSSLLITVN